MPHRQNVTATPTGPCVKYQFAGLLGNEFFNTPPKYTLSCSTHGLIFFFLDLHDQYRT